MKKPSPFISFFRESTPYINQHRGKTFVICIQEHSNTTSIIKAILQDILVLHALQIKIVIITGARHTLNQQLSNQKFHNNQRITKEEDIKIFQQIIGANLIQTQSILSTGLSNSSVKNSCSEISTGNFITAKPRGIVDGIDFGLTGEIRKVNHQSITKHLKNNSIVLLSPIGFSSTGETFNLMSEEVANKVAISIKADKLLFYSHSHTLFEHKTVQGNNITPDEAYLWSDQKNYDSETQTLLIQAANACENNVNRVHILPEYTEGSILTELFTRDGLGLMITNEAYNRIEQATIQDIPSLLTLIRPFEQKGILIRRSRKLIEMEINSFILLKRDNTVIGCAALYPYPKEGMGELACLVISEEYQKFGLAKTLLIQIEENAKKQGIKQIFCLTTQTSHWFIEKGYALVSLNELPQKKQNFYNFGRNSKPYLKTL